MAPIRPKYGLTSQQRHTEIFSQQPYVKLGGETIPKDTEVVILNAYDVRFTGAHKKMRIFPLLESVSANVIPMLDLLKQCETLPSLPTPVSILCPPVHFFKHSLRYDTNR